MPVCAPVRNVKHSKEARVNQDVSSALRDKLLQVVEAGHQDAISGKTVEAKVLTAQIRENLGTAS